MEKTKQDIKEEYAKDLLEISKNSVKSNESSLGEYLSTPMKRFPHWRPQDPGQALKVYTDLDKKKFFIFMIIFIAIFCIIASLVLQSMK